MKRREFLAGSAGLGAAIAMGRPAIAQARTKVRVGYLHTLAVDGQIWTGMDRGSFDKQNLDLDLKQFNSGLEIFQALIGGSLDVLSTGDGNKEVLGRIAKGWVEANDYIIANSDEALKQLQAKHYQSVPLTDLQEQFAAQKMFTSQDWKRYYMDGTVTNWLQQSTDFFMGNAGVTNFTKAADYFDPKIYLGATG